MNRLPPLPGPSLRRRTKHKSLSRLAIAEKKFPFRVDLVAKDETGFSQRLTHMTDWCHGLLACDCWARHGFVWQYEPNAAPVDIVRFYFEQAEPASWFALAWADWLAPHDRPWAPIVAIADAERP